MRQLQLLQKEYLYLHGRARQKKSIGGALNKQLMEKKIEINTESYRMRPENSEVERLWADNSKAKNLFGWRPEYTGIAGFKRGLTETINWFGESANLKNYKPNLYNL